MRYACSASNVASWMARYSATSGAMRLSSSCWMRRRTVSRGRPVAAVMSRRDSPCVRSWKQRAASSAIRARLGSVCGGRLIGGPFGPARCVGDTLGTRGARSRRLVLVRVGRWVPGHHPAVGGAPVVVVDLDAAEAALSPGGVDDLVGVTVVAAAGDAGTLDGCEGVVEPSVVTWRLGGELLPVRHRVSPPRARHGVGVAAGSLQSREASV